LEESVGLLAAERLNWQHDKQEEHWSSFRRIPGNGLCKLHHNRTYMAWAAQRDNAIASMIFIWLLDWILSHGNMGAESAPSRTR
jgi:hypothetical protein